MSDTFPRRLEDVTCEWLSGVLGGTVTGYQTEVLPGSHLSDNSYVCSVLLVRKPG